MNKRNIFLAFSIVILILGFFVTPGIPFIYGIVILGLLWSEEGGMSYGNPHRKKMLEEGRPALSISAHSPIKDQNDGSKGQDNYTMITLLGFGNIIYAAVLFFLMYG